MDTPKVTFLDEVNGVWDTEPAPREWYAQLPPTIEDGSLVSCIAVYRDETPILRGRMEGNDARLVFGACTDHVAWRVRLKDGREIDRFTFPGLFCRLDRKNQLQKLATGRWYRVVQVHHLEDKPTSFVLLDPRGVEFLPEGYNVWHPKRSTRFGRNTNLWILEGGKDVAWDVYKKKHIP